MYKCIKGFSLEKCDGDGFTIEDEYVTIEEGSTWYVPENKDYRLIGGEIRLENDEYGWIEISKETLEEHFRKQPVCFIPNDDTYPLCKAKRNRCNEVFITCQTCNLYEGINDKCKVMGTEYCKTECPIGKEAREKEKAVPRRIDVTRLNRIAEEHGLYGNKVSDYLPRK